VPEAFCACPFQFLGERRLFLFQLRNLLLDCITTPRLVDLTHFYLPFPPSFILKGELSALFLPSTRTWSPLIYKRGYSAAVAEEMVPLDTFGKNCGLTQGLSAVPAEYLLKCFPHRAGRELLDLFPSGRFNPFFFFSRPTRPGQPTSCPKSFFAGVHPFSGNTGLG